MIPLNALKAQIVVTCGVIPGENENEHTKVWQYSSKDYEADQNVAQDHPTRFSKMLDAAHEYAKGLSNPAYLNWVRVEWIWL